MLPSMWAVLILIWQAVTGLVRSRASLEAEVLTLRHQLQVLRRKSPERIGFRNLDRLVFAALYWFSPRIVNASVIVQPETSSVGIGLGCAWFGDGSRRAAAADRRYRPSFASRSGA